MDGLGASEVVEIIKHSINLEEFSVDWSLDEQSFCRIVRIVKGRPQERELKCEFEFNLKNCDEKQKVKLLHL